MRPCCIPPASQEIVVLDQQLGDPDFSSPSSTSVAADRFGFEGSPVGWVAGSAPSGTIDTSRHGSFLGPLLRLSMLLAEFLSSAGRRLRMAQLRLNGKHVVITGASDGIGRALAQVFASKG